MLTNENFTHNTLILLVFDETGSGNIRNTVFGLLLGDVIPPNSAGTTDGNFYDHYSQISTIEFNWDLHTLGRWDVGANVFSFAVEATDTCNAPGAWTSPPPFTKMHFDSSYPGPLNTKKNNVPWPAPDVDAVKCGRTVLPSIVHTWQNDQMDNYYSDGNTVDIPDGRSPPEFGDEPERKRYKPRRNVP